MKKIITLLTLVALGIPAFAQNLQQDKIAPPRQNKEQVEPVDVVLQRLAAFRLFVTFCVESSSINFSDEGVDKFTEKTATQLKSSGKSTEELSSIFKAQIALEAKKQEQFVQEHHLDQTGWCKLQQKVWTAHGYGELFETGEK